MALHCKITSFLFTHSFVRDLQHGAGNDWLSPGVCTRINGQ